MDLTKSILYFDPLKVQGRCHIIGCGSVGSTVAEMLARLGIRNFGLYDFDKVEAHNIANQMFRHADIGKPKGEAVRDMITAINPDAGREIQLFPEGYDKQRLAGYVFLCVDNIETRKQIAEANRMNKAIIAMFDFRTGLEDAQHYAADWSSLSSIDRFINTMNFTHEEARAQTPMSACNVSLCVAPTVRVICGEGVANFMNLVRGEGLKMMILSNAFTFNINAI